jgi:hypothetical protein
MDLMQEMRLREELVRRGYADAEAYRIVCGVRRHTGMSIRIPYPWERV